jgi:hypothetical protein
MVQDRLKPAGTDEKGSAAYTCIGDEIKKEE